MKKLGKLLIVMLMVLGIVMPKINTSNISAAGEDKVYEKIMKEKKIVIGMAAPFPPYEFYDKNNELQGLDVELGKKIAEKLGVEAQFENMEFGVLIGELQAGKIDVIISDITPTEERKQSIDFSDVYYTSEVGVLVKKENLDKFPTNAKFEGKALGAQAGTVQEILADEELKAGNILSLPEVTTLAVNLDNGKIDGLVVEDTVGEQLIQKYPDFTFTSEMIPAGDAAVGMQKNTPMLMKYCNEVIGELKDSGEIQKMYEAASNLSQNITTENNESSASDKFSEYGSLFAQGTLYTIGIALLSIFIGTAFGLLFVFGRQLKYVGFIFKAIVSFLRGTPLLVQLFMFAYVIYGVWFPINKITGNGTALLIAALSALGLNSGAYISEIMRAGINGVDKGQMEAARSLGLSTRDTMKSIILPQAIKNILPALGNEFIVIIKESAIVATIGVVDLMKSSQIMQSKTYDPFTPLIIAAIIYFVLTFVMSQLVAMLERRMAVSDRG